MLVSRLLLVSILLGLPSAGGVVAQSSPAEEADRLFREGRWEASARLYEQLTRQEPGNGTAWYRLGSARHQLQQYLEAIAAFERADSLGQAPQRSRYNIACGYALLGEKGKALQWLERALEAGFAQDQALRTDPDLAGLRGDERFERILETAARRARPCEHDPVYRQFDFWIGEWDVMLSNGQKAGTNSIRKDLNGCLLLETWASVLGGSGKSINYYDPADKFWVQVWVDGGGRIVQARGRLEQGTLLLLGEQISSDGSRQKYRMSFTPLEDGRVRQFIEQSRDGGRSWYAWFEGFYVRRPSP